MGKYAATAVIILNYNSFEDTENAVRQIERQSEDPVIIVVDNASEPDCQKHLIDFVNSFDNHSIFRYSEKDFKLEQGKKIYLVLNDKNDGYSAGNNIGFRIAKEMGAVYALLMNPDVRIENEDYLRDLLKKMVSYPVAAVAGTNIVDILGNKQSPSRIPTFIEEFFWFIPWRFRKNKSLLQSKDKCLLLNHETIHGCCMLLDLNFLQLVGYLDENLFMYCEEPTLMTIVEKNGRKILFVPELTAIHAHERKKKGNTSKRMKVFLHSRMYYIMNYSNYTFIQKIMMKISYGICFLYHSVRTLAGRR